MMIRMRKHYLDDQIKSNEMGRVCDTYGGRRRAYRMLVGKTVGKRALGRPRRRWEDNRQIDFQEIGSGHEVD